MSESRSNFLEELASRLVSVEKPHPVRVGIDGVDGAGKTCLADELVEPVQRHGRTVIRASIDSFHNPRAVRYRLGKLSPHGYFQDSFNHEALKSCLLTPLGPGGSRRFRRAAFDYRTDSPINAPEETAPSDAILLFDGIFLHRDELVRYWDYSVFLDVRFEETYARMVQRDGIATADPGAKENRRYFEGQQIYLSACNPRSRADLIADNNDLDRPHITD